MSATSRRLVLALRLLALALIGLSLAALLLGETYAWGLWPASYLPLPARWLLAALAAGLAVCGGRLSWPHLPDLSNLRSPWRVGLALACLLPFYLFRIVHTRWGDAYMLVTAIAHPQVHATYSWQAPLDLFVHAKVWSLGHAWLGWTDALPAYWLLSSLAGSAFVWVLIGVAWHLGRNATERWLVAGLVLTLGTLQLFFGYIENYTLMTLGVLLFIWLALRALRGEIRLVWPALALAVAHALHPATLVLVPALLYVAWVQPRAGYRRAAVSILLPYAVVGGAVLALMTAGGHGFNVLMGGDAPGGADRNWFVPLLHAGTPWEHYTMFSLGHLSDIVNEQLLAAPAILPGLALVAVLSWRSLPVLLGPRAGSDPVSRTYRFLVLCTACYLALIWTWNPDYGGLRDWDLFSPAAVPAALLLAYILPRALPEPGALRSAAWCLAAAQACHLVAWVYQNTRPWSWS